jgi:hypothetical protein
MFPSLKTNLPDDSIFFRKRQARVKGKTKKKNINETNPR